MVNCKELNLRDWVLKPKRYSRLRIYADEDFECLILAYQVNESRNFNLTITKHQFKVLANARDVLAWNIKRLRAQRYQ